jgi:hypothetical protein
MYSGRGLIEPEKLRDKSGMCIAKQHRSLASSSGQIVFSSSVIDCPWPQ